MVEFKGTLDSGKTQSVNNRQFKKLWWLIALFCVVFIALGIMGIIFREDESDFYLGIFLICMGALFPLLVFFLTRLTQKRLDKSMHILSDETFETYSFYPDKLVITTRKGDEYEGVVTAKYSYLYKVEETSDTYFLFISKAQTHVIKKSDLTQGSTDELNSYFAANLGSKFRSQKN